MIRLEHGAGEFSKIVTKRVSEDLFEEGILDKIVQLSGGSPRQLLRLTNQSLLDTDTKVNQAVLNATAKRLAVERLRPLTEKHRSILKEKRFGDVSPELLELLFSVNVMEYNGDEIERRINPLLESYFQ